MPQEAVLPDGTTLEFPDDASIEQIQDVVNKYNVKPEAEKPSLGKQALEAVAPFVRGVSPTALGAGVGMALGGPPGALAGAAIADLGLLATDTSVHVLNKYLGTNYVPPSQTIQSALSAIGFPESETTGARYSEAAARGVAGALGGIAGGVRLASAAAAAGRETGLAAAIGKTLADQPGRQIVAGATGGLAAEKARSELEKLEVPDWVSTYAFPVAQMAAGIAGGAAGSMAAGAVSKARSMRTGQYPARPGLTPEETAATIAEMEAKGQQVPTSYAFPPEGVIGRTAQRLARAGAAGDLDQELLDFRNKEVKKFFADRGITQPTNEFLKEVTADLDRLRTFKIGRNKQITSDIVAQGDQVGFVVPVDNSISVIDKWIEKFKQSNEPAMSGAIQKLEAAKEGLRGKPLDDPLSSILDASGQQISRPPTFPGKLLSEVDFNRDLVGQWTNDPSLASVKTQLGKAADEVYGAIKDDMRSFMQDNGLNAQLWDEATARLKDSFGELESTALRYVLNKGQVQPEAVERLLFNKAPSQVELLYKNLSPEGRRNAQFALLEKAYSDSMDLATGEISTVKVEKKLNDLKKEYDIYFPNPLDKTEMEGLTRMLRLTAPAEELTADPATGQRAVTPMIGLALAGKGFGKAAAIATTLDRFASFYESPVARKILRAIPKAPENSPEQLALVKRLVNSYEIFLDQKDVEDLEKRRVAAAFLPQFTAVEEMPDGGVIKTDNSLGLKMYQVKGKPVRVFDSNNQPIGIFGSEAEAIKKATDLTYKRVKSEIKRKEKIYAIEEKSIR
jgi:hypothetical protein